MKHQEPVDPETVGVQKMEAPTGKIFTIKSNWDSEFEYPKTRMQRLFWFLRRPSAQDQVVAAMVEELKRAVDRDIINRCLNHRLNEIRVDMDRLGPYWFSVKNDVPVEVHQRKVMGWMFIIVLFIIILL